MHIKSESMTIAIDCRLIGQSGIGTFIENVVYHMVKHTELHFVLIGNKERLAAYTSNANCRIVECNYDSFTLKELFCFPVKEVNQCDVFFTPNFNIPMGIRVPIFSTIHDVVFFDVEGICSPIGKVIRWLYMKRALAISKTVFTVSEFSKGRIESHFHPKCPVCICYSGISQGLVEYKQQHAPERKARKRQLVFLGNLKKQKGIGILIDAFEKVRRRGLTDMRLVIIGNMNSKTKDPAVIRFLYQKHEDIDFVGNASNQQVFDILSESLALVSPSIYEGLGLPPMEAMYLGAQAVISDIPVYKEIYGDTNATFFRSGDADDLCEKLLCIRPQAADLGGIVEKRFNFATVSDVIINAIHLAV